MSFERVLTYNGKSMRIHEWAAETGLKYSTIIARISMGWSVERTLNEPCDSSKKLLKNSKDKVSKNTRIIELEEIRKNLKTQPYYIDERREEGEIL